MGILTFLFAYLLGGITFIPLCILTFFYLKNNQEDAIDDADNNNNSKDDLIVSGMDPNFKAGKYEELKSVKVEKSGFVSVTNQYYYHSSELIGLENEQDIASTLTRSQLKKKNNYFIQLKHGNLFLFRDNSKDPNSLLHAISLKNCFVTIWPRKASPHSNENIADASLFTKKTCIAIFKEKAVSFDTSNNNNDLLFNVNLTSDQNSSIIQSTPNVNASQIGADPYINNRSTVSNDETVDDLVTNGPNQFFLYFDNNMEKEDWYFQLINTCKVPLRENPSILNPAVSADTAHLNTHDSLMLLQTLNSTEGQLSTKWLNALIGRLFLSLQQTDTLNKIILDKIYKKLTKIKTPGFLDDFVIQKVDVGNSIPFLTNPKLKELTPDGATQIVVDLQYKGGVTIIISTKVNINLGSRFKPREVSLQLSIKVNELSGPLLLLIKPPPSNRIWYAFETEPTIDLDIEPVVSSSKLSYNVVTNAIKSKFAEAIKESLVVPYMDDLVFFTTENEIYRGGIWNQDSKKSQDLIDNLNNIINTDSQTEPHANKSQQQIDYTSSDSANKRSSNYIINNESVANQVQKTISNNDNQQNFMKKSATIISSSSTARGIGFNNNDVHSNISNSSSSSQSQPKKKLFGNSIKKINRWYKENYSNTGDEIDEEDGEEADDAVLSQEQYNIRKASGSETTGSKANVTKPQMISNRRKTVGENDGANENAPRQAPPNLPARRNDSNQATNQTHNSETPEMTATEMFVNQSTASPRVNSNSTNIRSPNLGQTQFATE